MKKFIASLSIAGLVAGLPASEDYVQSMSDFPTLSLANITRMSTSDLRSRTLYGPFMGVDFPDPSIIWGDGSWKAYGTSSNGKHVPVSTTTNPTSGWSLSGTDALPDPGSWVDPNDRGIWAPDVQKNVGS